MRILSWLKSHLYADYPDDELDTMPDFHAGGMVGKGTPPRIFGEHAEPNPMGKRSPMEQALHERNQRTVERVRKDYPLPVHKGATDVNLTIHMRDIARIDAATDAIRKMTGVTPEEVRSEERLIDAVIAEAEELERETIRLEHSDPSGRVEMVDITATEALRSKAFPPQPYTVDDDIDLDTLTDPRRNSFTMQHGGTHYVTMKMQPFQFTLANGWDGAAHTALKYVSRHATKAGRIDLEKASHVLEIRRDSLPERDLLTDGTMDVTPKRWANKPISIQTYIDVNSIDYPEAEVLFALARWVWNPIDETVYEDLQTKLRGLIELRYPKL